MYQIRTAPAECRRKTRVPRNHTYDSGFTRRIVMERHRKNLFFFFLFFFVFFYKHLSRTPPGERNGQRRRWKIRNGAGVVNERRRRLARVRARSVISATVSSPRTLRPGPLKTHRHSTPVRY